MDDMTKPYIEFKGHKQGMELLDAYLAETERFVVMWVRVDAYSHLFNEYGFESAESFICTGIEAISRDIPTYSDVVRLDEKNLIIAFGVDQWGESASIERAQKNVKDRFRLQGENVALVHMLVQTFIDKSYCGCELFNQLSLKMHKVWCPQRSSKYSEVVTENNIKAALTNGQMTVHFQPIYFADGQIRSVEVLSRWFHPEYGCIPTSEYIPMLQRYELAFDLFAFNLNELIKFLRSAWRVESGLKGSINLEPSLFCDERVYDLLNRTRDIVPSNLIELELIETEKAENISDFQSGMQKVRALGYCIAIDDFGSGFGLANAHMLDFDTVKIDLSMVHRACVGDPLAKNIIRGLVKTYQERRGCVIAEGIEDMKMFTEMLVLGVDALQGYGLNKPMPAEAIFEKMALDSLDVGSNVISIV
jgi:EAL domain-containing protein (putative c-di-GMP-specific phosphodiesterase class I)